MQEEMDLASAGNASTFWQAAIRFIITFVAAFLLQVALVFLLDLLPDGFDWYRYYVPFAYVIGPLIDHWSPSGEAGLAPAILTVSVFGAAIYSLLAAVLVTSFRKSKK